jgi:hypothetical protein
MSDETTKPERPREPRRNAQHESAVDRLIELASDAKPAAKPAGALALKEPKDSDQNGMWKALLQLKALLPYASRLLPLLEIVGVSLPQNSGPFKELRESVAGIQTGQRELRLALQDQTLEIKRLEEEIVRLREASEKAALEQAGLIKDVKSIGALLRFTVAGLAVLLIALLATVGALFAHKMR